jgi:hypothetical protein
MEEQAMRSHWEENRDEDLDAPVTITERDLKRLRRRAGFGVLGALLGCVSIGGLGWTLYAGPEGLEQVQSVKDRLITQATPGSDAPVAQVPAPAPQPAAVSDSTMAPAAQDSAR